MYTDRRNTKANRDNIQRKGKTYPLPFVITSTNLFLFFSPPLPGLLPLSLLPPNLTKAFRFVSLKSAIICCATGDSSDDEAGEGAAPGFISASKIARDRAGVTGRRAFGFVKALLAIVGVRSSKFLCGVFLAVAVVLGSLALDEAWSRSSERPPDPYVAGIARGPVITA